MNSIVYLQQALVVQMRQLWLEKSIAIWGYFEYRRDRLQIKVPYALGETLVASSQRQIFSMPTSVRSYRHHYMSSHVKH